MKGLHIDSVRKSFKDKVILSDVFLECKPGEIVGLLGRNGTGKSTLLKIIFGTEKADNKFVRAGNKVVRNISEGRGLINYLPQENFLPRGVRIRRLFNFFLSSEERIRIFKAATIQPLLNKKFEELSGGEKRIVEILLLINSAAQFVLLDEPFNGLSPKWRELICSYIKERSSSKGFIISDHDFLNVINLSDRLLVLNNGHLKEVNHKSELLELGYLSKNHIG